MKKILVATVFVLCLAAFAGCSKDKPGPEQPGEATKTVAKEGTAGKKENQFVSADFHQGNRSGSFGNTMMRTEKGFYHYNYTEGGFRYYDAATEKEMFLCNKPECRHDGNEFCVATNQKYIVLDYCLYDGRIMVFAAEVTDTQLLYKVLSLALDGSSMEEVSTVFSVERTPDTGLYASRMYIHRHKALLTFATGAPGHQTDTMHYGTALFDLNTRDVIFLDEEPLAKENVEITDVTAYGDYFFYCRKEGKKTVLHRHHIENGTDESCKLLTNFSGVYTVLDEDYIVYLRSSKRVLCTYHFSTGQNEEKVQLMGEQYYYDKDMNVVAMGTVEQDAMDLVTDGTYLYVPMAVRQFVLEDENGEEYTWTESACVRVYNKELEEVTVMDMAKNLPAEDFVSSEKWIRTAYSCGFRYLGEDIYWCPVSTKNNAREIYVFRCKRSDFLAGEPKFTFVYKYSED